jgi:hypothetical protein
MATRQAGEDTKWETVARDVILVCHMTELTYDQLAGVIGAGDDSFGRCGPGNSWGFLGDVRTPQCAAHDQAVKDAQANGASYLEAQAQSLSTLPAAVGSYIKSRFG